MNYLKKITISVALATSITSTADAYTEGQIELCEGAATLAEHVMEHRQYGTTMGEALKIYGSLEDDNRFKELALLFVEMAYDRTRWHTESRKQRAMEDFRDYIETDCFERMRDN